jgi:uncharacterized membrane protein
MTVFKFDTPEGADQAVNLMRNLEKQELIQVQDAATVSWPSGAANPRTEHVNPMTGAGALGGAFWGMLFGLLFFVPFLGAAIGAGVGALAGHFAEYGISNEFIEQVRSKVTPGTSAVFLLTGNAVVDKVADAMKQQLPHFELIASNLSTEQEDKLRTAFGQQAAA